MGGPLSLLRHPWRPYRAFREFDRLSDQQCREIMRHLRKQRRIAWIAALATVMVVGAAVFIGAAYAGLIVQISVIGEADLPPPLSVFMLLIVLGTTCAIGAGAGLVVAWCVLRAAVHRRVGQARCVGCGYALLGLSIEGGAVRCPECGRQVVLTEQGLTPESIIPRVASATASSDRNNQAAM